jgi:hypothetical protein
MRTVKINMVKAGNYGNLAPPPDAGCFPGMDIKLARTGSLDASGKVGGMFTFRSSSVDPNELGMFTFSAGSYTKPAM